LRFRLVPRDESFFPLFDAAATNITAAAYLLRDLIGGADRDATLERLRTCEQSGDDITHRILKQLNGAFVTPFDREDIHTLAEWLDDVVDDIHGAGDLLLLHRVEQPLPELGELVDILVEAADVNAELIGRLSTLKEMDPLLEKIGKLESKADGVYRRCVARLFSGEFKAFEVLRSKDVVEAVEHAVNAIEKVSDGVETILLKHA
jgi:predicted phosphate transport protein (TIGR00153 family)